MIIRNKETGQTLQIDDPALAAKYGIKLPMNSQPQSTQPGGITGAVRGGSDLLRSVGLGAIPTIGSGLFEGGRAIAGAVQGDNAYKPGGVWSTDANGQPNIQDPFMSEKQLGNYSSAQGGATEALKNSAGLASWGIPFGKIGLLGKLGLVGDTSPLIAKLLGTGAEFAGKGAVRGGLIGSSQPDATPGSIAGTAALGGIAEPLLALLGKGGGLLTKGGTNKMIESAANKATQAGKSVKQTDLFDLIRKDVTSKFGDTAEVRNATNDIISGMTKSDIAPVSETPKTFNMAQSKNGIDLLAPRTDVVYPNGTPSVTGQAQSATFSPNDLLTGRRQILNREGTSVLKFLQSGKSLTDKISGQTRSTISGELKKLAPEINTPDQAYSLYQKLHGSPGKLLGGAIATYLFGKTVGKPLLNLLNNIKPISKKKG
jgi:hypothetical protein